MLCLAITFRLSVRYITGILRPFPFIPLAKSSRAFRKRIPGTVPCRAAASFASLIAFICFLVAATRWAQIACSILAFSSTEVMHQQLTAG